MLKPGDLVGPYEIRGFLGQGGMGQVYRAFDPRLERTVALKVMAVPTHHSADDSARLAGEFSARLLREARAVASLSHPNVVGVFDVGESNGRLYLAMEYVVGSTLRGLAMEDVPLARKVRWLVDVARALEAAHRAGLVHRDIKPENVMVREDGVVKVLDFGIARRTLAGSDQASVDTVTGGGAIAGTPVYMAPEQIKGGDVDARCDQFAWGVMAYELLAGERPWSDAGDTLALVARVLTDPVTPLRERPLDVPAVVDQTILRALEKAPGARFPSMTEIAEALEPFAVQTTGGDRLRVLSAKLETSDNPAAFAATTRIPTSVSVTPAPSKDPPKAADAAAPAKRPKALRLAVPLVLLAALIAVVVVVRKRTPTGGGGVGTAPRPLSTVPAAETAYTEAMVLWRAGATGKARAQLVAATRDDPTFAAAHLRLAIQMLESEPAVAQASFQSAFEHRHMLTEVDRMLLDATEPLVQSRPDIGEWETRMKAVVWKYKNNPELQYYLGRARERQSDDEAAKEAYQDAVRLDRAFVPALAALANVERNLGNREAAEEATVRCVAQSPSAAACRETRYRLYSELGQCGRAREEAGEWRTREPQAPLAVGAFARALHADGAPRPSVEEALTRRWNLLAPERRKTGETWDRMLLAIVDGDLSRAEELARDYELALPEDADQYDHAEPTRFRINLLLETDRVKDAAKVASDYLDRRDAWPAYAFAPDASITFYEPLVRSGALSRADLEGHRKRWAERERARHSLDEHEIAPGAWVAWSFAWGSFAESRDEALEALAHQPTEALPKGARRSLALDFNLGKAYALAGRAGDAIGHLERVSSTCYTFDSTLLVARARYFLGLAYEATGDKAKARTAYESVTRTWTRASGSRTVKRAEERLAALGKGT